MLLDVVNDIDLFLSSTDLYFSSASSSCHCSTSFCWLRSLMILWESSFLDSYLSKNILFPMIFATLDSSVTALKAFERFTTVDDIHLIPILSNLLTIPVPMSSCNMFWISETFVVVVNGLATVWSGPRASAAAGCFIILAFHVFHRSPLDTG